LDLKWTERYSDPGRLRQEVRAMVDAFVEALLGAIPAPEIAGIYFKGSAQKGWDSPVDYVPELSDVDVNLLFRDSSGAERWLGTVESALDVQRRMEEAYRRRIPAPLHIPRPQLVVLNKLREEPNYCPSPKEIVTTLYGEDYRDEPRHDDRRLREIDRADLLSHLPFLETFPLHVVDKPGTYVIAALRNLSWRVSPIGPRMLSILGMPPKKAWSLSRTQIIPLLEDAGEGELAKDYATFYMRGWDYFLSGHRDSAAARDAVAAGVNALKISAARAEKIEFCA